MAKAMSNAIDKFVGIAQRNVLSLNKNQEGVN